jgi:hypothetical protein
MSQRSTPSEARIDLGQQTGRFCDGELLKLLAREVALFTLAPSADAGK